MKCKLANVGQTAAWLPAAVYLPCTCSHLHEAGEDVLIGFIRYILNGILNVWIMPSHLLLWQSNHASTCFLGVGTSMALAV